MYAGLFFNLKQGFRERCRRRVGGEELQPLPPSLPTAALGRRVPKLWELTENLLSVFCCLFWGGRAGPGQELWMHRGPGGAPGSALPSRGSEGLGEIVDFPQAKKGFGAFGTEQC